MNAPVAVRRSALVTAVPYLVVAVSFMMLADYLAHPVTNIDTYFHLRLGHEFLADWSVPEPGGVTRYASADWVPSQWLGQVALAQMETWFGLAGVAWLGGAWVLGWALSIVFVTRAESSLLVAACVLPLTVISSVAALTPRPQVFTYMFAAYSTLAWLRASRGGRVPWELVPLTWVWANLHGMWVLGVVISAVGAAGIALDRSAGRFVGRMALVPVLSCAVAALTPVGPRIFAGVVRVGSITGYFEEWAPPDFTRLPIACAALMLGITIMLGLRAVAMPWARVSLVLLALAYLVYSNRTVPVAAAMAAPLLGLALHELVPRRPRARYEAHVLVTTFVVAVAALAGLTAHTAASSPREDSEPSSLVAALPEGTGLLNEWSEGGIDLWLYPDLDVVMHGYGDMFTSAELERNLGLLTLEPGWEADLRDLRVAHALLRSDSRLFHALTTGYHWEVVAQDEELSYLVAPEDWLTTSPG